MFEDVSELDEELSSDAWDDGDSDTSATDTDQLSDVGKTGGFDGTGTDSCSACIPRKKVILSKTFYVKNCDCLS